MNTLLLAAFLFADAPKPIAPTDAQRIAFLKAKVAAYEAEARMLGYRQTEEIKNSILRSLEIEQAKATEAFRRLYGDTVKALGGTDKCTLDDDLKLQCPSASK